MKRFKEGQKYVITQDARYVAIARVVEYDGKRVAFEFQVNGKTRCIAGRIRIAGKPGTEVAVHADYDVIFAYDALGGYR